MCALLMLTVTKPYFIRRSYLQSLRCFFGSLSDVTRAVFNSLCVWRGSTLNHMQFHISHKYLKTSKPKLETPCLENLN